MRVLFIDDDPARQRWAAFNILGPGRGGTIIFAKNYYEALTRLDNHDRFDVASLDHDLFYQTIDHTGYDVCLYIVRMPEERRPKRIVIHSHNQIGRERMATLLRSCGLEVSIEPFKEPDAS